MKITLAAVVLGITFSSFFSGCQSNQIVNTPELGVMQSKAAPMDPSVNLERGMLTASGIGLPPKSDAMDPQAKQLARRAAIVDGQRNLAQKLATLERRAGLPQTDPSTVKNYVIIEEKQMSDGGYRVVLQMKLDSTLIKRLH